MVVCWTRQGLWDWWSAVDPPSFWSPPWTVPWRLPTLSSRRRRPLSKKNRRRSTQQIQNNTRYIFFLFNTLKNGNCYALFLCQSCAYMPICFVICSQHDWVAISSPLQCQCRLMFKPIETMVILKAVFIFKDNTRFDEDLWTLYFC